MSDLVSSQDLLRIVTDDARVGLIVVNSDRRYLFANRIYAEILDLPSADIVGKRVQDVLPGVYEEQIRPRLDRAFSGTPVDYELRKQDARGDRFFAVHYVPVASDGAVTSVVVMITEATEKRQTYLDAQRAVAIVDSSDDAIIGKDLNGIVTSWNPGAERIFGYSAEDIVGTSIMRLIPEDRQDEERQILERIRNNQRVRHFETLRRTKTGDVINVSITTSPIKDAEGRVVGASKVARDITARKRAEEARRFQEAMLLTERELTLDGILVVGERGEVLSYNGRFARMWDIPKEVLATKSDATMLQAVIDKVQDPGHFLARIQELYDRHDEASQDEVELHGGRVFERYSAPMRDANGRYYGRVWYFRDATERKRAESALRHERDRAQRYLDTADVMLLALDAEGRITLINRKGCELLGWSEAELLGRDWIETCLPVRIRPALRQEFGHLTAGDLSVVENPILTRTGEELMIEWRNRLLLDNAGQVVGSLSSGTDITERRLLEAQYHQSQKMEAVGRLAGGLAHDFNNLLTAILGYSEMLLADLPQEDPRWADVSEIQKAGESAASLTRQLLTFSRKQAVEPTSLDLNVVIGNMGNILSRLIGEDVRVVLNLVPPLPMVRADSAQIEQIILNLAVNARDAMPNGGTLTIEASVAELDENYAHTHFAVVPGSYVVLIVSDTGIGMSQDVQGRLFEPFFTTKERGKGTGLGLSTVYGVVKQWGGNIVVYSELGLGTTFKLYFPVAAASRTDAGKDTSAADRTPAAHGELILLVEDEKSVRRLAEAVLTQHGYEVLVAQNGEEAVRLAAESSRPVDLLLSDVIMPGMTGPQLAERLQATRPDLPVLFMSGYTGEAVEGHEALGAGAKFLDKPFSARRLLESIGTMLSNRNV